jgi:hypothetical protein
MSAIAQYNEVMQQFYDAQHMSVAGDWVEHSLKRVATAEALGGRDRLKERLQRLGLPDVGTHNFRQSFTQCFVEKPTCLTPWNPY